jgi:dTDP-L-rhamnose 4-epimerase
VIHLAALVGVGQSMYAIENYTGTNDGGTAVLMQALLERPVERVVVASSMSIYGEGLCRNAAGEFVSPPARSPAQLKRSQWEPTDKDGRPLAAVPTPEWKQPDLTSIYALGKFAQERMCLLVGRAYNMTTTALRFFNVYGPRQALSNPYTGVLAIFASRLLNGRPPLVFEDGEQRRDFVHVKDVARCCRLALEAPHAGDRSFNVASGENYSIRQLAALLAEKMGMSQLRPQITSHYRVGDIRHCFADISAAESVLGYKPAIALHDGLGDLVEWVASQVAEDKVEQATDELVRRGLVA